MPACWGCMSGLVAFDGKASSRSFGYALLLRASMHEYGVKISDNRLDSFLRVQVGHLKCIVLLINSLEESNIRGLRKTFTACIDTTVAIYY
jgi:hypothetical protein